jgi:choline dehydrogenase-like flavoprotein
MDKTYDVVIIGSGISGALAAVELGKAGKKVLILEAGRDVRGIASRNLFTENFYKETYKTPESPYPDEQACRHARTVDLFPDKGAYTGYLDQALPTSNKNFWFKSTNERLVGGTTWHWLGTCLQLLPTDFRMKSTYGIGSDWPIDYNDMLGWYKKAADAIGIAGDPHQDILEKILKVPNVPYPMPEIPKSYLDRQYGDAIDGHSVEIGVSGLDGLSYHVTSTPQARNSQPGYQGRPQCCGNSSCIPICPVGAKYDATYHINLAVNQYGAVLQPQSVVTDFEADDSGEVTRVNYLRWWDDAGTLQSAPGSVEAPYFILAAHAIESAKILLSSTKNKKFAHGVGNTRSDGSEGVVGKYLMDHPCQLSWAQSNNPVFPFRGPISTSGIETLRENSLRNKAGAFRIQIGNDGWIWPVGAPYGQVDSLMDAGMFGKELYDNMQTQGVRQINLCALIEQEPNPNFSVTLSSQKDALGIQRPKIKYGLGAYETLGLVNAMRVHQQIFEMLGATGIQHKAPQDFAGAGHILGTAKMGTDEKDSVVNGNMMCHNHKNLMILGSSTFPTEGTANPTFTIAALALMASDHLIRVMK